MLFMNFKSNRYDIFPYVKKIMDHNLQKKVQHITYIIHCINFHFCNA